MCNICFNEEKIVKKNSYGTTVSHVAFVELKTIK